MSSTLASSNRQGVKARRIPTALTRTIVWTFPDRSRPNFRRQGGKTGGPNLGLCWRIRDVDIARDASRRWYAAMGDLPHRLMISR
jgi:hypothetical protein